jgi:hypothetical protein
MQPQMKLERRDSWQEAWQLSLEYTVADLRAADLADRCAKSGATLNATGDAAELTFLGARYRITPPEFDVARADSDAAVPITDKILLLHYLATAGGKPVSGEWMTFGEVPGGDQYLPVFRARSLDRLVAAFEGREDELIHAGERMGATPAEHGDVSVVVEAFPRVPVAAVLWRGDDEFSASGAFLFDKCTPDYLPAEDMVVIATKVVGMLMRRGRVS